MSRTDLQGVFVLIVSSMTTCEYACRWIEMMSLFNERQARLYAAEKAMALGHGGITLVSEVLGLSSARFGAGSRSWSRRSG